MRIRSVLSLLIVIVLLLSDLVQGLSGLSANLARLCQLCWRSPTPATLVPVDTVGVSVRSDPVPEARARMFDSALLASALVMPLSIFGGVQIPFELPAFDKQRRSEANSAETNSDLSSGIGSASF